MEIPLTPNQIFQLIVPGVSVVFAFSFLSVWIYDKTRQYLVLLFASFIAYAVGSTMEIFHWPADWKLGAVTTALLFVLSALSLNEGVLRRRGLRFRWTTHLLVLATVTAAMYFFSYVKRDILVRVYILNFCIGFVVLATAFRIRSSLKRRAVDQALFWVLLVFGLSFFVRTVLTVGQSLPHSPTQFGQTAFWVALQMSLTLFGVVLALVLLAATVSDVIEHVVAERDLDALTQILNRRAFELRATRLAADRKHRPLSMVICDIDHFKSVNDRFGHAAGDEVLREFSRILRAVVRADDIVGRIGGEEFVILLPGADRTLAKGIAERLRTVLMSTRFAQISSTLHVTVSAGVAQYQDDETVTTLLARADRLLYAAKRTGRNCTVADEAVVAPEASTRYLA